MRKTLLAVLLGTTATAPVLAQSSLTIYGIADAGIQVSRFGAGTQYNLQSGIADGSRLGFKGTEDLGGGYKAIFNLEQRIELDNGGQANGYLSQSPNRYLLRGITNPVIAGAIQQNIANPPLVVNTSRAGFDRTSYVGMVTPVGALLLGRQYTPGYEVFAGADPFETGTAGSWGNVAGGSGGFVTPGVAIRYSSALQYRLQLPNGIGASLMYAPNNTGSVPNLSKRAYGFNVRYQANNLNVGIGHNREQDQNGASSLKSTTLGGSYVIGDAKLFAGYHHMRNDNSVLVPALGSALAAGGVPAAAITATLAIFSENAKISGSVYTVGAHYQIGNGRIMTGISHTNDKRPANNDVTLYAIGYDYNLSKRTDLYTVVGYLKNQNTAQFALGGAGYTGGSTAEPGKDATALQFGIRHRF